MSFQRAARYGDHEIDFSVMFIGGRRQRAKQSEQSSPLEQRLSFSKQTLHLAPDTSDKGIFLGHRYKPYREPPDDLLRPLRKR